MTFTENSIVQCCISGNELIILIGGNIQPIIIKAKVT